MNVLGGDSAFVVTACGMARDVLGKRKKNGRDNTPRTAPVVPKVLHAEMATSPDIDLLHSLKDYKMVYEGFKGLFNMLIMANL
ncbi:hypothetical protein C0J52_07763 [Blattella germanica]|nr:hypothetical protein C0J52_07763 [Blattella germanica]